MNIIKKKLFIKGMTCVNCQNKIEQKLARTPGIKSVKVSYNKGTADIAYDTDEISLKEVIRVIEGLDYQVVTKKQDDPADLERIVSLLILIVSFYVLLQQFGILNLLVPNQLADSKMGYGALFVVGLLTSVHCIAMCGGINLSCCLPQKTAETGVSQKTSRTGVSQKTAEAGVLQKTSRTGVSRKAAEAGALQQAAKTAGAGILQSTAEAGVSQSRFAAFVPAFAYNAGRVVSYTAIGMFLGFAGMLLGGGTGNGISVFFQGILKLIAGVFMVIMGINMLELFPWLRRFHLRMPKFFAAAVGRQKRKGGAPFVIGLLNGLMPCGPLQSMQIVALASADPVTGAISMFFFSLGTVPLMLGFGSLVAALGRKFTKAVTQAGAVLVTVLGLAMLSQGVSLSGLLSMNQLLYLVIALCVLGVIGSAPFHKAAEKYACMLAACALFALLGVSRTGSISAQAGGGSGAQTAQAKEEDGVQVVNSTLSAGRYPNITVTAGVPVRWIIDAPEGSINGCNYKMLIRDYGIEHIFQKGENVIEFTPAKTGTVTYTCWMGMIRGNIFVADAGTAAQAGDESGVRAGDESSAQAGQGDAAASVQGLVSADPEVPQLSSYRIPAQELAVAQRNASEDGRNVQNVEITLTRDGFFPAVIVVEKGVETNWTIKNERSGEGETEELLAMLYSAVLPLAAGENTLYLYPEESFDVSTGDNAYFAYVKVVDDLENMDADEIRREVEAYQPYIYPSSAFEGVQTGGSCCY